MTQEKAGRSLATDRDDEASLIERAARKLSEAGPVSRAAAGSTEKVSPPEPLHRGAAAKAPHISVDLEHLAAGGYLTPATMHSPLAEEVRLVKRSVVQTFWHQDVENANLIMVTSAFPGEGKSFTALNLAISLACEVDFHILLVDTDFERSVIFERLGIPQRAGLLDVLKDPSRDLSEVLYRTNIGHLSVIGPGRPDTMSPELLGSQRMQLLAQEMANRYPDRLIIFDSPPLLSSSDPAVLAEHVGQVLFIVEADTTPKEMIESALERLPANCSVGLVLNKGRSWRGSGQYPYYGYGKSRRADTNRES